MAKLIEVSDYQQTGRCAAYGALKAKGVKAELLVIPDIGKTPEATHAASNQALKKTLEFIDAIMGGKTK